MITGEINAQNEAILRLRLRGGSTEVEIEATLDTGFTEYLTLPPEVIEALVLPRLETTRMELADGTTVMMSLHEVGVYWDGELRFVFVHATVGGSLIGMKLLKGSLVTIEVVDGGAVNIEALE